MSFRIEALLPYQEAISRFEGGKGGPPKPAGQQTMRFNRGRPGPSPGGCSALIQADQVVALIRRRAPPLSRKGKQSMLA
jgi:hypothetical protein